SDSSTPSSLDVLVSAACASEENDFSNFPQAVLVDPHEIQSNVNQKSTRQMEGSSTTPNKDSRNRNSSKHLKSGRQLKGMSTSKIDETTTNLQIVPITGNTQAKQTRSRTTLTGEFSVSFELPDDFPEDANVDTLVPQGSETDPPTSLLPTRKVERQFEICCRVVRFILYEEYPNSNRRIKEVKGSAEKMTKSASVKRKSSVAGCSKNPPEENKEGLDGHQRRRAKTEEVKVSKEEEKHCSPIFSKEEEAPINPPTEDQPNPPTEMDQPNPAVNHEEVGHGNASQNDGNGGDLIYGLLVSPYLDDHMAMLKHDGGASKHTKASNYGE
ncbi:hypothetical protein Prudu_017688, partial [Prunus dulcis]